MECKCEECKCERVYLSSYCNHPHCAECGAPVEHECDGPPAEIKKEVLHECRS